MAEKMIRICFLDTTNIIHVFNSSLGRFGCYFVIKKQGRSFKMKKA